MRTAALIALFVLAGCKGVGLGSFDTGGYATPPGLSQMDSHSPDAEEDKWLKSYYGESHGWGWDPPANKDPNCGFYNTCGGSSGGGGGGFYGGQDNPHNNTASDW